MSASRMPVFSPSAAKPSARLQEVVDLPTPPLPEATAMTCLTPGMPAAFDVARAFGSGRVADTAGFPPSQQDAPLLLSRRPIILRRPYRPALRGAMRGGARLFTRLPP